VDKSGRRSPRGRLGDAALEAATRRGICRCVYLPTGLFEERLYHSASGCRGFYASVPRTHLGADPFVLDTLSPSDESDGIAGDRDLTEFLFGAERSQLTSVCRFLTDLQSGGCFYCKRPVSGSGEVDHFIPWSRYPSDLGHNFVMAHATCNRNKGASLAAECHLENWVKRNEISGESFAQELRRLGIVTEWSSSRQVACWAYEGAAATNAPLWNTNGEMLPSTGHWRTIILTAPRVSLSG